MFSNSCTRSRPSTDRKKRNGNGSLAIFSSLLLPEEKVAEQPRSQSRSSESEKGDPGNEVDDDTGSEMTSSQANIESICIVLFYSWDVLPKISVC